jgi:hypothetical protein
MINKKLWISSSVLVLTFAFLASPIDAHAVMRTLNEQTGQDQTFQNDSNVTISSSNDIHSLIWQGVLPLSRGGTGANSFTNGSIPFIFGGVFADNNANFFWDNTNNRLGIGTTSPEETLDVSGIAKATSLTSTDDSSINTLNVGLGGGSVSTNTSIGKDALLNATSSSPNNTAVGFQALKAASNGSRNTAIGYDALLSMTSGGDSTAVGALALGNSTTGSDQNTAIGSTAMSSNTTGSFNSALGVSTLNLNTTGEKNTALGYNALYYNNGSNNIGIGFRSGIRQADDSNLTSPESSIYIGNEAKGYDDNDSNSIVLGSSAVGAGENTAVIGNTSLGDVYFGSSSGAANTHAKAMYLGNSSTPGCIVMGDSDGSGVTYLTANDGVLTASSTKPSVCP